jgi:hypothetical protein
MQAIICTLRIVHVTNRILRELLNLAGFKDERSVGLEESLNRLQTLLDNPDDVDRSTRDRFGGTDSEPDIATLLTKAKSQPLDNFRKAFPAVRKLVSEIAERCERIFTAYGIDSPKEQSIILPLPRFILMWDIIGSTTYESRDDIESLITNANRLIYNTFGKRILGFHADSKDDSNNFACEHFTDVLKAFQILNNVFRGNYFRAGCDVNMLGPLNFYPESKSFGGRAFEYAARVRDFFKEIKSEQKRWSCNPIPPEPGETSYMVVGEFAKRHAQKENEWPESESYIIKELEGVYEPRVNASLPMSVVIFQPQAIESKSLENTGIHGKQRELI